MTVRNIVRRWAAERLPRALVRGLGVTLALQTFAVVQAAERYPVWFSPDLDIESVDQIDARLAEPFWGPGDAITMGRYKPGMYFWEEGSIDESVTPFPVTTCQEFLDAVEGGFEPLGESGREREISWSVWLDCRDIETPKTARPAARSYVQDFAMDERAPNVLPATMSMPINCERGLAAYQAHKQGRSWADIKQDSYSRLRVDPQFIEDNGEAARYFENIFVEREFEDEIVPSHLLYDLRSPHQFRYESEESADTITVPGRADFNGDELEDLMIRVISWARGGTLVRKVSFIVTRDAPAAVMRDLSPESWICDHDRDGLSLP